MNQSQRRATALTNEQISYIKGCARLQSAIWRLTHRDPLMALSDRMSKYVLRQAILTLIETRKRLRKQNLKSSLDKWAKNSQFMTFSNARRQALLKSCINRNEALKRFILSHYFKNWRNKCARSVEDFLGRIGAFMKLMESGIKRRTRPVKKEFLQSLSKTISPEFYTKPLKGCLTLYDKCQRLLKNRAVNTWRNKVRDLNNKLFKRQLLLKNIVKPIIANNQAVLRHAFLKWKQNVLGLRNETEKLLLLRGHTIYSIYNKWKKANQLKLLSRAFNDWRRKAAIRPVNMLKHNINMNAEDLLTGLRSQYLQKLRRDLLKKQINRINKNKKSLLAKAFEKWRNMTGVINVLKSKLKSILRAQVNKNDLIRKMILRNAFKNWLLKTKSKEGDILNRYGAMLRLVDLLAKSALRDTKNSFFDNMKKQRNPNYYKKALKELLSLYKRCELRAKRKAMNNWHDTTKKIRDMILKRTQILKNRFRPLNQNRIDVLRRVFNKWRATAKDIKNFTNIDKFIEFYIKCQTT